MLFEHSQKALVLRGMDQNIILAVVVVSRVKQRPFRMGLEEMSWRIALSLVFVACTGVASAHGQVRVSPDQRRLLELVNQAREHSGLQSLAWNDKLSESAQGHALLMAKSGILSHQLDGEPFLSDRIGATGLRFSNSAENVATAYSVDEANESLMKSPPHRASILNPDYNALGIAIVARGDDLYIVENFARVIPTYTAAQFRDAVVATFNKERRARGFMSLDSRPDGTLERIACSDKANAQQVIDNVREVGEVVIFTNSSPEDLPSIMLKAAGESKMDRMNVGVCFAPSREQGFANFRVVVAFHAPHY